MIKRNVSYPDFETEINIKLDNIIKRADVKGLSDEEIRKECCMER